MGPWHTEDTILPFFQAELIRSCSFLLLGKSTASVHAGCQLVDFKSVVSQVEALH